MANITEPDVISFLSERLRPYADLLVGMAQDIDVDTVRYTNTVAPALAGNVDEDLVADGSDVDGRTQMSKAELVELAVALGAIRAAITPARFATLVKASVNVKHL